MALTAGTVSKRIRKALAIPAATSYSTAIRGYRMWTNGVECKRDKYSGEVFVWLHGHSKDADSLGELLMREYGAVRDGENKLWVIPAQ